jgi:ribonucleotide monophosphatase NagD (HAD superfamily)
MIKKSYPAVFLDVDGVIKVGNEPIKKAKEAIELIR